MLKVHNVDTGLNYETIQEAINAPETLDGHIISVETGTYHENVVVNKTVSLVGENRETTIIDGGALGSVMYVMADNVTIKGLTITNGSSKYSDGGIGIYSKSGCNITQNNIVNNYFGV